MNLLAIIIDELLSLALFVVLMRLLLQLVRADFRNPICQAIVRLTNPLIIPLRRVLPPIRKLDTATVVAVLMTAFILVAVGFAFQAFPINGMIWIMQALLTVAYAILWIYFWSIIVYALLSLVAPGGYSPMQAVLASLTEPVLGPIRRLIPSFAGIDLSPLWACLAIQVLLYFLPRPLFFAW
jgi:YggT family protein